jgi:hypothetical protein
MQLRQDSSQTKLNNALRQELENLLRTEPTACLYSLDFLSSTKNPSFKEAVEFVGGLIADIQGLDKPRHKTCPVFFPVRETRGNR